MTTCFRFAGGPISRIYFTAGTFVYSLASARNYAEYIVPRVSPVRTDMAFNRIMDLGNDEFDISNAANATTFNYANPYSYFNLPQGYTAGAASYAYLAGVHGFRMQEMEGLFFSQIFIFLVFGLSLASTLLLQTQAEQITKTWLPNISLPWILCFTSVNQDMTSTLFHQAVCEKKLFYHF